MRTFVIIFVSLLITASVALAAPHLRSKVRSPTVDDRTSVTASASRMTTGEEDRITNLPGLPTNYTAGLFGGYIDVNPATGRNLFYIFTEAQSDPANAPVVLWLNGGPGCSSLTGLFTENGPFMPDQAGNLVLNPSSWNLYANVIYLDSPSGVGFSYSTNTSDYKVGDKRTADDAYNFLVAFLNQKFPQYSKSKFWVTGESYGGHYVPNLAKRIVEGNRAGGNPEINLQGFMVGNAWTDAAIDNKGAVFDWWSHALISDETYNNVNNNCDFSKIGPLALDVCTQYTNEASAELGKINIYQIYEDVCQSSADGQRLVESLAKSPSAFSLLAKHIAHNGRSLENDQPGVPPCISNWFNAYLNVKAVQDAIHAKVEKYYQCSPVVEYSYQDLLSSMIPVYQFLFDANIRILVYSGDVDGIVPTPGTRAWIKTLNMQVAKKWYPWYLNGQVGGHCEVYDKMTFTTIRGAGHMVPGIQPQRALYFFKQFLDDQPF